jgi:hypothetical protein
MSRRHPQYAARPLSLALSLALSFSALLVTRAVHARATVGNAAQLFVSHDENLDPVDMFALTKDKPLVLIVGSAS